MKHTSRNHDAFRKLGSLNDQTIFVIIALFSGRPNAVVSAVNRRILFTLKAQLLVAPKYLRGCTRPPLSATSSRPLRSWDIQDLFVPRARKTVAQPRSLTVIGPS